MGLAVATGAITLRLFGRTWRIERRGVEAYERRIATGERCIFAFWHARLLPLAFTHRHRGYVVLVSRSRDGELIAGIVERLGFETARGSSTRGGDQGVRGLLAFAARKSVLGIAPDGPRGPAERVKPGLVYLASRTGLPVVPVASAARSAWVLRSWDRFRVPWPFTRVVIAYGEPIAIPRGLDTTAFETWRVRIEDAMMALTREVSASVGERS